MRTNCECAAEARISVGSELERVDLVDVLKDQIEEARGRVAHFRLRAERPSARLEDEYALEKARTRLLTLELKSARSQMKSNDEAAKRTRGRNAVRGQRAPCEARASNAMRTKHKHLTLGTRERAEASFAALQKEKTETSEEC